MLAAAVAFGLAGSLPNVWTSRTQAGQVAAALAAGGRPGDVVAFCPDQLGPAVDRLLPAGRYRDDDLPPAAPARPSSTGSTTPRPSSAADPAAFATHLERLAARRPPDLVRVEGGYQTLGTKCEAIGGPARGRPPRSARTRWWSASARPTQQLVGYEGMGLIRFTPVAPR